ncbi:MAG: hypothetical protein BWY79_01225 [Actinobacteria bacterium ADurb.Bin444]|nr:MAG: hypothetical protein BWY79_01225 [Actinobacteria bacterium ADurb.Bin444]
MVMPLPWGRSTFQRFLTFSRTAGSAILPYPGTVAGRQPMSQAPWTLFCPRRGFTPVPGRPSMPHSMARLAVERTLSVPVTC